ncbi:MAG: 3-methyladenine DNA glycosylase [Opitutaceae bacterium]
MKTLEKAEWQHLAEIHRARAEEWTLPYRSRRARGAMHPVYDFLFIYYRFAPAQLEYWHPGKDVALSASEWPQVQNEKAYSMEDGRVFLDTTKIDAKVRKRLQFSLDLCRAVKERPPQFGCFGMHEWAMVYKGGPEGRARHEGTLPFRLAQRDIDRVVESRPICCSHFDAFRFFTDTAMPFNRVQPTQEGRLQNEQSGCLHTNMDLYKWTAKCMPWVGTELQWDTFQYAIRCREIDMRASPYDCGQLGYEPIPIETAEGRETYEQEQRKLTKSASALRNRLINALEELLR